MNKSSRDKVLDLLESCKGSYLSGEELASQIGISRTAVWKAIKRLQSEGYTIDAVTNRGYCLISGIDRLSEEAVRRFIGSSAEHFEDSNSRALSLPGIELDVYDTVDSTNTICLKRASSGKPGTYAAIAGCQTRGRGRRGRSFFSPENTGLYMSILLRPSGLSADQAVKFTTIAAVAVSEAIEALSEKQASIKWVNDVYVEGRKVCGILTEASFNPEDGTLDYAVVGIGINVYEPEGGFPEDIRLRAGSIAGSSADAVTANGGRNRLAAEILVRFFSYLGRNFTPLRVAAGGLPLYVDEYRQRCFVAGMDVDVIRAGSEPARAHVLGIDDDCRLMVRYEDGTEEVLGSGEISIGLQ